MSIYLVLHLNAFYILTDFTEIFEGKINISTYENKSAKNGQIRSRPRQVGEGKYNNFLVVFVSVINTIIEGKHCQGT